MSYKVKLNFFDGPLDLLLFLIKKDRINIYDIPIAHITEQYLSYLELMELLDLVIAGDFLVMAATLLQIKSSMLLPNDELSLEGVEEGDPREELVKRLLEYKKYKSAAGELFERYKENKNLFFRRVDAETFATATQEEYLDVSLVDLIDAFRGILKKIPKETFHKVSKHRFTVGEKIDALHGLLRQSPKIYFSNLFKEAESKEEVIVIFLAVLELMKRKEIRVVQGELFDEIEIVGFEQNNVERTEITYSVDVV
ncbi:segregation and condensation protein A [Candidatus Omnitrophus magneticus]|uniref:Segregation and condensation protein A n=1 Tax=Candidatus Omnitrophus magneticus TaxID=1609969 RepID=A0A0F0CMU5_9BACT|nr:segregation and condensation protein A [Candidatus Omnitrophus magneticus]